MAGESSPSLSPSLPTAAGYFCPPEMKASEQGGFGCFLAPERAKPEAQSQISCWCWDAAALEAQLFNTLSVLWSLGEDRGSQSPWVMDTALRKMGMLQGLSAWDLLLLLQQSPEKQLDTEQRGPVPCFLYTFIWWRGLRVGIWGTLSFPKHSGFDWWSFLSAKMLICQRLF